MRRFLFMIFVILMTPIYLILCFLGKFIEIMTDITEPIADGIEELIENMMNFGKKYYINKRKGKGRYGSKNRII